MKKLEDYYKNSLFYQSIMNPLDRGNMLNKEGITEGIETYTVLKSEIIEENGFGIIVRGECNQYFVGRNLSTDQNIRDTYDYEVKVSYLENQHIALEIEADIERYNGDEEFWKNKVLPTANIATIGNENGQYHISFQEYYYLFDGLLIHDTSLHDRMELYEVLDNPDDHFEMGDSLEEKRKSSISRITSKKCVVTIEKMIKRREKQLANKVNQK